MYFHDGMMYMFVSLCVHFLITGQQVARNTNADLITSVLQSSHMPQNHSDAVQSVSDELIRHVHGSGLGHDFLLCDGRHFDADTEMAVLMRFFLSSLSCNNVLSSHSVF